jgi:alpha-1,2-mannosyltransferase
MRQRGARLATPEGAAAATPLLIALAAVAVAAALPRLWAVLHAPTGHRLVDLSVYRDAGVSLRHHRAVYEHATPALPHPLPFTYPAFSALLAAPLALIPTGTLQVLWTLLSVALLAWCVWLSFRGVLPPQPRSRALWLVVLTAAAVQLQPVYDVFRFGQVGLILLALVSTDLLVRRVSGSRGAGVLSGVATALKLTPGIFVPALWLAGRRRMALLCAGTAIGLTVLAFAIAPHTSHDFWFSALRHSGRLGDNADTSNQAIRGMTLRAGLPTAVTVLAVLAVAAVGLWRSARADSALGLLALTGLLAVLLSPVAWIHHLVWIVPVLGVLAAARRWRWLLVVAVFFALPLPWWGRTLVRHDVWGGAVLQDAFGLAAVALVLLLPLGPRAALPWRRSFGWWQRKSVNRSAASPPYPSRRRAPASMAVPSLPRRGRRRPTQASR